MTAGAELRVQLVEKPELIPLAPRQWQELVSANETDTVFQSFEWFGAWWRIFGDAQRLFFLVVRDTQRIVGFAALMVAGTTAGLQRLQFVGTGNADYQDFVLPTHKREAVAAICAFLRTQSGSWQRAWLCNIPAQSSTRRYLEEEGRRHGLYLLEETHVPCPVLRLDDADGALARRLGKYSMRRPLNWFARRGEVRLRHVPTLQEIESLLPAFFDQHIRRWNAAGRRSPFHDARQQQFFRALAQTAHGAGWLQFSVLEVAGEPIAFHFGFDYRGSITWYKPSFEVRYAERSPGLLLIRQLIEDALERRRCELDFTIGGEPFKERFANMQRSNVYVSVYHNRAAYLIGLAEKKARRLAGSILRRLRSMATARPKPATREQR